MSNRLYEDLEKYVSVVGILSEWTNERILLKDRGLLSSGVTYEQLAQLVNVLSEAIQLAQDALNAGLASSSAGTKDYASGDFAPLLHMPENSRRNEPMNEPRNMGNTSTSTGVGPVSARVGPSRAADYMGDQHDPEGLQKNVAATEAYEDDQLEKFAYEREALFGSLADAFGAMHRPAPAVDLGIMRDKIYLAKLQGDIALAKRASRE